MIEHIVLFRWKPDATPDQIAAALDGLRSLQDSVPGIESLACGADVSGRAQGYTHALVACLADRAALDAYGPHPAHQAVVKAHIAPLVADVLAFDFEVVPHG